MREPDIVGAFAKGFASVFLGVLAVVGIIALIAVIAFLSL